MGTRAKGGTVATKRSKGLTSLTVKKRSTKSEAGAGPTQELAADRPTGLKLPEQGSPIKGLTFGVLADALPKIGVRTPVTQKRIWLAVRDVYPLLSLTAFKVHPLRGGPFNDPFMQMSESERSRWAEGVLASPPPDMEAHVKKMKARATPPTPVEVYWELATLGNVPKAVLESPMHESHIREGARPVVDALLKGRYDEARDLLLKLAGRSPPAPKTEAAAKPAKKAPKSKPAKKAPKAKPGKKPKTPPAETPAAPPAETPAAPAEAPATS